MGSRFDDSFWSNGNADFCNTFGYDALSERMKDAKHVCDDFQAYIKQRAAIEETYAKALIKLGKTPTGAYEIGTLKHSWDALHAETEQRGNNHQRLAQQLVDEIERPAKEFRDCQREIRRKTEEQVKKAQKNKVDKFDRHNKARRNYESKCREADKLDEEVKRGNAMLQPKELEKLKQRAQKAREAVSAADQMYKEAVEELDLARAFWEMTMEQCCQQYQSLEERRIEYLRNAMWYMCNICSVVSVHDDDMLETCRSILERCNVEEDIKSFIDMKSTGFERPAPIEYSSFYPWENTASAALTKNSLPVSPMHQTSRVSSAVSAAMNLASPSASVSVGSPSKAASATTSGSNSGSSAAMTTANYVATPAASAGSAAPAASAAAASSHHKSSAFLVKAAFDYDAQGPEELTLKEGDTIKVLERTQDTWWRGYINGRVGMFPVNYVVELS